MPLGNYYRATANPVAVQPPLIGNATCDVIVIGGGFTGAAAALAAAERGASVILLEAETIGFGASGRNGGQLIPGLRWTARDLIAAFGLERARAIHALAMAAVDRVKARIARHAIACDLASGHLETAHKPADFVQMRDEVDLLTGKFGRTGLDLVAPADVAQYVRTNVYHGGVFDRDGGHFHPLNYVLGLAAAAISAGATIHEHSPVTAITDSGGKVGVTTARGSVVAAQAILAADAWTCDIVPALGRFTVPLMNYVVATAPLGDLAGQILPTNAAIADSRFVLNYFRLSADRRLIFGGGERYRRDPPRDIGAFVRPRITRLFPQLCRTPIDFGWGGTVSVTMNRLPQLGRRGNILFAHGFSGHGALLTTLAGELLAEAAAGPSADFDLLAALPHRLFPGGKLMARPLATLGLLYYAMKDRL
ncbi:MAG: FAD-binding oxidoreductase [Sphingomicrobium sp.]